MADTATDELAGCGASYGGKSQPTGFSIDARRCVDAHPGRLVYSLFFTLILTCVQNAKYFLHTKQMGL